jgi:hypothetical protein
MSPVAWQLKAGTQTPPWQLVEQQSPPLAQAWPRTPQVWPGRLWQLPVEPQLPVQHWSSLEQAWETSAQVRDEQVPFTQALLQHSGPDEQDSVGPLQ